MFERRRPATQAELVELLASFDVASPPAELAEAEVSEVATIDDLAAMHTVLENGAPRPGADRFYTLAECEGSWGAGGGSAHDRESYGRALTQARNLAFAPPLLFAPTQLTSSRWWMVDGIHRAAALLTRRRAVGAQALNLRVFVLQRPL